MVFQSYAVWPHMTVFDNVAYGLRVRKQSAGRNQGQRRARARPGADAPSRRAAGLQAVGRPAAARGAGPRLAFSPTVVLFDEPLSQPRRQAARRDARRAARAAAPARHHLGLCHARPGGGARHLRPRHRHERGRDRADRHARADLQPPAQPLRRRLRGLGQHHQGQRVLGRRHSVRDRGRRHAAGHRRAQAARQGERGRGAHGLYRPRGAARRQPACPARCASACSTATSCNTSSTARWAR